MDIAIVTGAGRGIGRAVSVRLARAGWGVVGVARTEGELEETARQCGEAGGGAERVVGSVTDDATAGRAVAVAGRLGRLRAVVYCAGVAPALSVEETTPAVFREVVETNLTGAFVFARSAWGVMKAGGGGSVVVVSSMASRDPFPGFAAYAPAKAGVNGLVLALDREGKAAGIRAYGVAPGAVETAMLRKLVTSEQWPTEKTLSADEVAEVIEACLCGALRHCRGETVFVSR